MAMLSTQPITRRSAILPIPGRASITTSMSSAIPASLVGGLVARQSRPRQEIGAVFMRSAVNAWMDRPASRTGIAPIHRPPRHLSLHDAARGRGVPRAMNQCTAELWVLFRAGAPSIGLRRLYSRMKFLSTPNTAISEAGGRNGAHCWTFKPRRWLPTISAPRACRSSESTSPDADTHPAH
jgi:hypothetical protein